MTITERLAAEFDRRRIKQRWTVAALAREVGVSRPAMTSWCSGKTRPPDERLDKIAAVLETTSEALYLAILHPTDTQTPAASAA